MHYTTDPKEGLPVVRIRDSLHVAVGVVDADGSARNGVCARIKAQQVGLELVGDRGCDAQEEDVCLAVIEHQPHTLQQPSHWSLSDNTSAVASISMYR